jgi:Mg-chelatase subunit ChlD
MKKLLQSCVMFGALVSSMALAADPTQSQTVSKEEHSRPTLEVVFVLDTTSSMGGLIEGAKEKIWSIASRMATGKPTPQIKVGLVGFRDRGDAYVTKRFELTGDLDSVYSNLKAFRAEGGGDGPEHVGQALGEAVRMMSWSQNPKTAKMIFVVGDAPPHDDYQDGWNSAAMAKEAIKKGIVVNTIQCGAQPDTQAIFRQLAKLADGHFDAIAQTGGMVAVETPYDAELGKLNAGLADTSVYVGSSVRREEGEAQRSKLKNMSPTASSDRLSFRSNAGMTATTAAPAGSVDVVAAPAKLASVSEAELPVAMQKMSKQERVDYVNKQASTRSELEKKVLQVSKERDAWIQKNASEKKDSFDGRVFESVKASAAKVGVAY